MTRLKDKVIIVTGGSGLIGKTLLEQIRCEGGIGFNAEISVKDDLDNGLVECDITNDHSISETIAKVMRRHGRLDGLVNNAYPRTSDWGRKFEEITAESWKRNVDMQLNSIFSVCQQTLKIMAEKKVGSIVNIASTYGIVGPDFTLLSGTYMTMPAAYSAVKGGIINFTRYLASYYGHLGIRINCYHQAG